MKPINKNVPVSRRGRISSAQGGKYSTPTKWDLSSYFFNSLKDPRIDADIATWLPITQAFAKRYKGKIKKFTTSKQVLEYYEYNEKLSMVGKKVLHYLSYLSALDTQDTEVQKKLGELQFLGMQLAELTEFASQEWKELGAKKIRAFANSPLLKPYRNALINEANTVQYILSEPVEQALIKKSRALGILDLHEELRSSFLFPWKSLPLSPSKGGGTETSTLPFGEGQGGAHRRESTGMGVITPSFGGGKGEANMGNGKTLTEEEIRAFAKHPNRALRKQASESMQEVYLTHQHQITLGNLYTAIVKDWVSSTDLRGYKTVMSKRNISEELPDAVVDTLMSEVQKYYPLYQRFLRAKQKHLKLNELFGYDVHAPIFPIEKKIPYEEACKMVGEMFESLSSLPPTPSFGGGAGASSPSFGGGQGETSLFGSYARSMISEGRIDVFPRPGKRGGAFASYDKDLESFVLLNYTNTIDDVFTLAHELGHAIHGHLSQGQKSPVYNSPLVLAETASIFSESLLMKKIQKTLSKEEKLELLNQKLLDIFGSIHRQIMYVSFERRVHEYIQKGGELTYKELNIWWDEEARKLSGDAITPILPPEKNYGWSAIPHIFNTPFYCYAYSFGMLVSLALIQKYETEGAAMIDDFVTLLASGGSVPPVEILQSIGIDVLKPSFYSSAFATIEELLEEFEK